MAEPFTAADFLSLGFESRGFKGYKKLKESSQKQKFRSLFGTSPDVIAAVWEDLRSSNEDDTKIGKGCKPIHLLLMYRWLKSYESEDALHTDFNICVNTISKWCKILTEKVASLRKIKVKNHPSLGLIDFSCRLKSFFAILD